MAHTGYTRLFIQEGSVRVRLARVQTRLVEHLRGLEPGQVATRAELTRAVWPDGCDNANRLDQQLHALNRKRLGLVLWSNGLGGWYLDPAAWFGTYDALGRAMPNDAPPRLPDPSGAKRS